MQHSEHLNISFLLCQSQQGIPVPGTNSSSPRGSEAEIPRPVGVLWGAVDGQDELFQAKGFRGGDVALRTGCSGAAPAPAWAVPAGVWGGDRGAHPAPTVPAGLERGIGSCRDGGGSVSPGVCPQTTAVLSHGSRLCQPLPTHLSTCRAPGAASPVPVPRALWGQLYSRKTAGNETPQPLPSAPLPIHVPSAKRTQ